MAKRNGSTQVTAPAPLIVQTLQRMPLETLRGKLVQARAQAIDPAIIALLETVVAIREGQA